MYTYNGMPQGKTRTRLPNQTWVGMRHVEALRCSLYINSLPERGVCSMELFFIAVAERDHPLNEHTLLLGIAA